MSRPSFKEMVEIFNNAERVQTSQEWVQKKRLTKEQKKEICERYNKKFCEIWKKKI